MKLNRATLKRIIKEELDMVLNENFDPDYIAQQMMKGGGRFSMFLRKQDEYEDEDPNLFTVRQGLQNADHIGSLITKEKVAEVRKIGQNLKPSIESALEILDGPPTTAPIFFSTTGEKKGVIYAEHAAAVRFLKRVLSIIEMYS